MSNMKRWLRDQGISYSSIAAAMDQTKSSICQKVNLKAQWQKRISFICMITMVFPQILFLILFRMIATKKRKGDQKNEFSLKANKLVDELQFASGRRMKPSSISQTNNRKETERQTGIRTVNRGEPDSHSPRQPRNV